MKVCINGGHFVGVDPGALGGRTSEAEVTFDLMGRVAAHLEAAGCNVLAVHRSELADICRESNEWGADIFVSIHCNDCPKHNARGTETFSCRGSVKGKRLAACIQKQVVDSIDTIDRGVKEAGFYVLKHTDCPAALIEVAFIDNDADEQLLLTHKDEIARAIARGITDYISGKR